MFDPAKFLEPTTYTVTPAARMVFCSLEAHGHVNRQWELQVNHMANCRQNAPTLAGLLGGTLLTVGEYELCVLDSIYPSDHIRRTVICVKTEIPYQWGLMREAAGLIDPNKKA